MKKLKINMSVMMAWFISYIIIFSIPLLIFTILYHNAFILLQNEIDSYSAVILEKTRLHIDQIMEKLNVICEEVNYNERFRKTQYFNKDLKEKRYELIEAVNFLSTYNKSYNKIELCILYPRKNDIVLSGAGTSNNRSFYYSYFDQTGISYDKWKEIMSKNYIYGEYISLKMKDKNGVLKDCIAYIKTLPIDDLSGGNESNFVAFIDKSYITKEFSRSSDYTYLSNMMLKSDNSVLYYKGQEDVIKNIDTSSFKKTGSIINDKYIITYTRSQIDDIYYVSVLSADVYWAKLNRFRDAGVVCFGLSLVALIVSTCILLKWNYTPLKKLLDISSNINYPAFISNIKEYNILQNFMKKVLEEKKNMEKNINLYNAYQRNKIINNLLLGKGNEQDTLAQLKDIFGISLYRNNFCLAIFNITDIGIILFEDYSNDPEKTIELIGFIIKNMADDLTGEDMTVCRTLINNKITVLFNFNDHDDIDINYFLQVINKIQEVLKKDFILETSISISRITSSVNDIPDLYEKTSENSFYQDFSGDMRTVLVQQHNLAMCNVRNYSLEKENNILHAIKHGDKEKSLELVNLCFNKSDMNDNRNCKILKYSIMSTLYRALYSIFTTASGSELREYEDFAMNIDKLSKEQSFLEFKCLVENLIFDMCDIVVSSDKSFSESVIEFIRNNYNNPDLNVSMIADKMQISSSYLSKRFKQERDINLLEYLNKYRMNKAIDLMKDNKLIIRDISSKVGYINYRTFSRLFVASYGLSPSDYRDKHFTLTMNPK